MKLRIPAILLILILPATAYSACEIADAAWHGKTSKVARYIKKGVDLNCTSTQLKFTPMQAAISSGLLVYKKAKASLIIVQALVDAGADLSDKGYFGASPVPWATGQRTGMSDPRILAINMSIIKILLEHGGTTEYAIHNSAAAGDLPLTKLLVEHGVDIHEILPDGRSVIELAEDKAETAKGDVAAVIEYLKPLYGSEGSGESEGQAESTDSLVATNRAEIERKVEKILVRDQSLDEQIRIEKYMFALTAKLKKQSYADALIYFELLSRSNVDLDADFDFFQGEALLRTQSIEAALEKFYSYIQKVGSEGEHYTQALTLIIEAEEMQ